MNLVDQLFFNHHNFLGYGEYFKTFTSELSKRRKSLIPDYRNSVNSFLATATNGKYDLPTYIMSLHSVGKAAYKRSSISRPDLNNHVTTLDEISEVIAVELRSV